MGLFFQELFFKNNLLDIPLYLHRYCFFTGGNQRFVLIVLKPS